MDISMARTAAEAWKARDVVREVLGAYTTAVACLHNRDRGRSIETPTIGMQDTPLPQWYSCHAPRG